MYGRAGGMARTAGGRAWWQRADDVGDGQAAQAGCGCAVGFVFCDLLHLYEIGHLPCGPGFVPIV